MENFNDTTQERTKLNPFLSVWMHPKQTARFMIDVKSVGYAILILSIGYIGSLLSSLIDADFLPSMPVWLMVLLCIIFAPIAGIIGTAFSAFVSWLFGKLFKGTATFSELFKGLSLTTIPFIVLIPFYLIWLFTDPNSLLAIDYTGPTPWIFWLANLATAAMTIWSFVISVGVVAEAHQFSNWKAFFTIIIPSIIFGLIIFVIIFIVIIGMIGVGMM